MEDMNLFSLEAACQALASRQISSLELTQEALGRIKDPNGQGAVTFIRLFEDQALTQAKASDQLRQAGLLRSALDGIVISIKDLFDVQGVTTLAGSQVLGDSDPAGADATIVHRLRRAGVVILGTTNMTEFAYSGLGLNPHYGTPLSPWDRETGRVAGGSSSGAAVSVIDGMALGAVGTDTGGSVRIPAAFCGLVGYKPTACLIDRMGTLPLSDELDSIGPIGSSVAACAQLADVLKGRASAALTAWPHRVMRLAVPNQIVFDGADDVVTQTFASACQALALSGVEIITIDLPELDELAELNKAGGFTAAQAWAWHRGLLQSHAQAYDPRVRSRIMRAEGLDAKYLIRLRLAREDWIARVTEKISAVDALLMPTVPIVAPALQPLINDDEFYSRINLLVLRNASIINFLDGCAVSIPCHAPAEAPVGLMLAAAGGRDDALLSMALRCEDVMRQAYG
jgi:aspartyl-tRNA(Asn)/glutamyl-tRNA(Gln) amidotransferase subunit A